MDSILDLLFPILIVLFSVVIPALSKRKAAQAMEKQKPLPESTPSAEKEEELHPENPFEELFRRLREAEQGSVQPQPLQPSKHPHKVPQPIPVASEAENKVVQQSVRATIPSVQRSVTATPTDLHNADDASSKPSKATENTLSIDFDLRQAVIYSEILKPKFDEE